MSDKRDLTEKKEQRNERFVRTPMGELELGERTKVFREVPLGYTEEEAQTEAKRCLGCKKAFCVESCPVEVDIPGFIRLIAEGDFRAAAEKIKDKNVLPAVCGRVCPQEDQCEKVCVLAKKGDPIAIGHLERFAADWEREKGTPSVPAVKPKRGQKVGIVGSGPAGLTAAFELIKEGFDVDVYEALHEAGGVLVYGIPEFRLPKAIVKKEISLLEDLGVRIVRNFIVGRTTTVDELMKEGGCDAVFIGSGAGLPSFLRIPGENSIGVYSANEYLTRSNLMKAFLPDSETPILRGRRTVTVGGGNVAMDSARTALRLGAEESIVVYRRTEAEMPARKEEIRRAHEEGVIFMTLCNPVEILADEQGFVRAMRCQRQKLGEPDASGRRRPIPIPDSEFTIDCDSVVIAVGNKPNPLIQNTTPDIAVSEWGTIVAGKDDGRTSKKFVYAGGDIVTGAATVILAMGAGKAAARSIIEDLSKR